MSNYVPGAYGRGWAFPPSFTGEGAVMAVDLVDIRQSLRILFSTQPGERIMRPAYGCDLQSTVFENIRPDLLADISVKIKDSVERDEPRVKLDEVDVTRDARQPSQLNVRVAYHVRGSDAGGQLEGKLDTADGFGTRFV
ncbi:GPW/gp25 family protein [Collimonas humicola]|uniref:GPW/gp25 family protein n=1 Tax=Collimonas humicola TaxID=2825886 RepID=UPI001B8D12E3|nr:GPW/gp25 family protein [Collimonas humicola]